MRKILFLLVLITGVFACKTTKTNSKLEENSYLQIDINQQYELGERISIKIKNISGDNLVIFNPTKKNFQKKTEKGWVNLRILPCPCDAPCKQPSKKMDLSNEKEINLNWNQKESFCGEMTDAGIRETVYKKVEKGAYRFAIMYKSDTENKTIYKEFSIK